MKIDKNRGRILLVDDNKTSLTMCRDLLKPFYEVHPVFSAAMMFDLLEREVLPDLILLDVAMPIMDGYEALKKLKSNRRFCDIPVIFLTSNNDIESEIKGFELGVADYITKPFSAPLLLKRVECQVMLRQQQEVVQKHSDSLSALANKKVSELRDLQNTIINAIADLVEFRDDYTGGHNMRAQLYMKALINGLIAKGSYTDEIFGWDMDFILPSSQLHDIGKIALPDTLLRKSEKKLTREESDLIKTHVKVGVETIEKIIGKAAGNTFLRHALRLIGAHHERWDGTGYPAGLKGSAIPLEGRLMAVADSYDALISKRPNKTAYTHEEAKKMIEERSGTFFDPAIIEIFTSVEGEFERIARRSEDLY